MMKRRQNKNTHLFQLKKQKIKNRESVLHVLAETSQWLDRWCKGNEEGENAKE